MVVQKWDKMFVRVGGGKLIFSQKILTICTKETIKENIEFLSEDSLNLIWIFSLSISLGFIRAPLELPL